MKDGKNYGYAQLHANPLDEMLETNRVGARDLLCPGRRRVATLNGRWHHSPDIYDNGIRARWFEENGGEFEAAGPVDYVFDEWEEMELPACWNTVDPRYELYEGSMWFFRRFSPPPWDPRRRLIMRVGAANYAAMVFHNGRHVASHLGGFTPFDVDLSPTLVDGENRLLLWVSNRRRPEYVPAEFTDWFNYGGVYRDIDLYLLPEVHVRDFDLRLDKNPEDSRPRLRLQLNQPVSLPVHLRVGDLVEMEAATGTDGWIDHVTPSSEIRLWSPEAPTLYDYEIRVGEDRLAGRIGFRRIERRDAKVYLNGRPYFLKGISTHEEGVRGGRRLTEEERRSTLGLAKELGCNFVRLAHYPHDERMAELADELGLLLWEEIPVYWSLEFDNPRTVEDARNQMAELVRRDLLHPSVAVWGVGNENPDTNERLDFMRGLVDLTKQMDDSRLVAAACLVDIGNARVDDRLVSHLDVVGINQYYGWYYGTYERLAELVARPVDRPTVISEFGADAVAGLHGRPEELWTEEYQAEVYRRQLDLLLGTANLAGVCPWLLHDFKTPRRLNAHQRMYNLKGLVDRERVHRKLAYGVLKSAYEAK